MTNQVTYLFFHGMKQISENLFTTEEQAIIARSKAEGSYMKAPNGQATNLNEKQWAQVRTRAFREWFGDWENNPDEASRSEMPMGSLWWCIMALRFHGIRRLTGVNSELPMIGRFKQLTHLSIRSGVVHTMD